MFNLKLNLVILRLISMQALKRFLVLCLAFWLFTCQIGLAWSVSTCLITGAQKVQYNDLKECCKMPQKANNEGFTKHFERQSCCKIDQHLLKLNSVAEKKIQEKKIFQNFIKNIQFFENYFTKKSFNSNFRGFLRKLEVLQSLKIHLSFLQVFQI